MEQLQKTQNLIKQALRSAQLSLPQSKNMTDAKHHMRQAIVKLEQVKVDKNKKKQENSTFWDQIVSNVANQPLANVSQEAYNRSLKELDSLLSQEEDKLKQLEKLNNDDSNTLLNG